MSSHEQAVFMLRLVINVAPVAVYFLALGMVNSQSRPRLVSGRSDFIALTLVFVPVLVWPIPILVQNELWWIVAAGLCGMGGLFWWLLPEAHTNWVVYNISEQRCRRMLTRALQQMGLTASEDETGLSVGAKNLRVELSSFALLNNVSLHVEPMHGRLDENLVRKLRDGFDAQLDGLALLPSPTGACLVLLGVGLLIVPLSMVSQHMGAIVEIVTRLFSA